MRPHDYMPRPLAHRLLASSVCAAVLLASTAPRAQRASPHESTSGSVQGADLTITYGRPYMRGRAIMGSLVPYGRVWCPGADEATILATSAPLTFGELTLAAGRYSLWMLPSAGDWQLIVNRQTGQWHTQHDPSVDIGRVTLEKRSLTGAVEQLTFAIEKSPGGGGAIVMRWEKTEVRAPFGVNEKRR